MEFKEGDMIYNTRTNALGYFDYFERNAPHLICGKYIYSALYEKGTSLWWSLDFTRLATPEDIAKVLAAMMTVSTK